MIDKKIIGRIHKLIRDDFKKSAVFSEVYNRAKVGAALFKCEECGKLCYTGSSKKNLLQYQKDLGDVTTDKLEVDHHTEPVIPYDKLYYEITLDEFVSRVYCDIDKLKLMCFVCHREKTSLEATLRAKHKQLKKLQTEEES